MELIKLGHTVRVLPTQCVKPFVVGGKNDVNDAAAICPAVTRRVFTQFPSKAQNNSRWSLYIECGKSDSGEDCEVESYPQHVFRRGGYFPLGVVFVT